MRWCSFVSWKAGSCEVSRSAAEGCQCLGVSPSCEFGPFIKGIVHDDVAAFCTNYGEAKETDRLDAFRRRPVISRVSGELIPRWMKVASV